MLLDEEREEGKGGHWNWGWLNQSTLTAVRETMIINVSTVLNFTIHRIGLLLLRFTAGLSTAESNHLRAFIDPQQAKKKQTHKDSKS